MSDSHVKNAFAAFFNPKAIIPFLIGALILAVLGNAVYQLLTNVFGTQTPSVLGIIGIAVVCFALAVTAFVWQANRPGPVVPLDHLSRRAPRPRRGLIFLFGRAVVCQEAVDAHADTLERLWLICTPESDSAARAFVGELRTSRPIAVEVRVAAFEADPPPRRFPGRRAASWHEFDSFCKKSIPSGVFPSVETKLRQRVPRAAIPGKERRGPFV